MTTARSNTRSNNQEKTSIDSFDTVKPVWTVEDESAGMSFMSRFIF